MPDESPSPGGGIRRPIKKPVQFRPMIIADQYQSFNTALNQEASLLLFSSQVVLRGRNQQGVLAAS